MKIFLDTYGCALNKADSELIRATLSGHEFTDLADADAVIINSCGVKNATESKIVSAIADYLSMKKRVIVAGCLPRINPRLMMRFPVSLVDPNSISMLPEAIASKKPARFFSDFHTEKAALRRSPDRSATAVVPISEGCLGSCAYCGVKKARGNLTSYSEASLVKLVGSLVRQGKREIFITAQDTGCYGADIGGSLPSLISKITAIDGDFMVRVGMMNPDHAVKMLDALVGAFAGPKVYRFLHLPVQSGSDSVLKSMNRFYKAADFERIVGRFRKEIPDIAISTDIIAGFPTETDADFEKTVRLINRTRPDMTNVSKFYPRPNTPAAEMKLLPTQTLKERSLELSTLFRRLSLENNRRYVGRVMKCLAAGKSRRGDTLCRAPNFKQVLLDSPATGFADVEITGAGYGHLKGRIVGQS